MTLQPQTAIATPLKYQMEIDSLKLSIECPQKLTAIENEMKLFRFCHNPIDLKRDFLPNVVYDKLENITFCDYSAANTNEPLKCSRCGASFNKRIKKLIETWDHMSPQNKENFGYGAIAEGILATNDGLIKIAGSGHVSLYEFETATFHTGFNVVKILE